MMIRKTDWQTDKALLTRIRHEVFVDEQAVPLELELDEHDPYCHHWLALVDGQAVGTVRMRNNGSIGRMAVSKAYRNRGIGKALLQAAITYAKDQDWRELKLAAQDHAIDFYAAAGFVAHGDLFMDAGIPHQSMQLLLRKERKLGRDSQSFRPENPAAAVLDLCGQARRTIRIFSHALEADFYAQDELVQTLSAFARIHHQNQLQLLICDESALREQRHPLVALSQRLPSAIPLRVLPRGAKVAIDEYFLIADNSGILTYTTLPADAAWCSYHLPPKVRDYQNRFDHMWEFAETPRYLRKLY
ncbi:GNAT family N-acetyltransferase [Zhongshania marina]|nr:GNAT family N-acetyltransferase [Marortus luteolus]